MRIKTIVGVTFASAAAAAVVAGGVAYASEDGSDGGERVRIVYEDQGTNGSTANLREDCPDQGGSSEAPGTTAPADSL